MINIRGNNTLAYNENICLTRDNDFVICLGYKSYHIKEYFYTISYTCDVTFDFKSKSPKSTEIAQRIDVL